MIPHSPNLKYPLAEACLCFEMPFRSTILSIMIFKIRIQVENSCGKQDWIEKVQEITSNAGPSRGKDTGLQGWQGTFAVSPEWGTAGVWWGGRQVWSPYCRLLSSTLSVTISSSPGPLLLPPMKICKHWWAWTTNRISWQENVILMQLLVQRPLPGPSLLI